MFVAMTRHGFPTVFLTTACIGLVSCTDPGNPPDHDLDVIFIAQHKQDNGDYALDYDGIDLGGEERSSLFVSGEQLPDFDYPTESWGIFSYCAATDKLVFQANEVELVAEEYGIMYPLFTAGN